MLRGRRPFARGLAFADVDLQILARPTRTIQTTTVPAHRRHQGPLPAPFCLTAQPPSLPPCPLSSNPLPTEPNPCRFILLPCQCSLRRPSLPRGLAPLLEETFTKEAPKGLGDTRAKANLKDPAEKPNDPNKRHPPGIPDRILPIITPPQ